MEMNITFSERAAQEIEKLYPNAGEKNLKLKYDTEDTGCVMCGVTVLWFVKELSESDEKIETNAWPVYVEPSKNVFLDDELKIDYVESAHCFSLKSPSQILNARMSLIDKTIN